MGFGLTLDCCHYNCSSQRQSGGEEKRDSHQCARVNNDMISLVLIERLKNEDVEFLVNLQYIGESKRSSRSCFVLEHVTYCCQIDGQSNFDCSK